MTEFDISIARLKRDRTPKPKAADVVRGRRIATGGKAQKGRHAVKVTIGIDSETFQQARALAIKEGVCMSEKLRELIEWGLEAK